MSNKFHRALAELAHDILMNQMRVIHTGRAKEVAFSRVDLASTLAAVLLLLLLLPALADSRSHAGRTICRNNLRQMANASAMYATDNLELMAYPNWGSSGSGWLFTGASGSIPDPTRGTYLTNPIAAYRTGLWFDYVRDTNAYLCPIDLESPYYKSRANKLSSYVMNGAVCGYGQSTTTCKITDPWSPECYLLYQPDESLGQPPIGAFAYNDGSSYPDRNEGIAALHSAATADILTIGGSVRSVTKARVNKEQSSAGKSFAWWNPSSPNGR